MAFNARQTATLGPAAIAVEDDGEVLRERAVPWDGFEHWHSCDPVAGHQEGITNAGAEYHPDREGSMTV